MDPAAVVTPEISGYVTIGQGISLHYELYLPRPDTSENDETESQDGDAAKDRDQDDAEKHDHQQQKQHQSPGRVPAKVLLVMGAFATKAHFASTARFLADTGSYEVLMYDHRGVGMSGSPLLEQQTCGMLAEDAVAVVDAIWGPDTALHVYGASMGGMVAQELALLLLPQRRLLSLGLAVTCRGLRPLYGLLSPLFVPRMLKAFLEAWYYDSRPEVLVRRVMRLVLPRGLLAMRHPSGQTYEQVYYREWISRFDHYWTFSDHAAGACHACICLQHFLPERKIAVLRDCGVPILCQVSTKDRLIPAAMQFELADKLRAKTVAFPTGHMGLLPWKERYHNMLLEHLAAGDALKGVREAEWRWSSLTVPGAAKLQAATSESSSSSSSNDPDEDKQHCTLSSSGSLSWEF